MFSQEAQVKAPYQPNNSNNRGILLTLLPAMEGDGFGNGTVQLDKKKKMQQGFQRSFVQVQSILDQNRLLIDEISQNQESKVPAGLTRNVGLIRDLNNNFHRVFNLYADLSTNFSTGSSEGDSTGIKPDGPA